MAIDGRLFEQYLAEGAFDPAGGPIRMSLVTDSDGESLLVVPVPDRYAPAAGDVWLVGVLRPAGARLSVSAGWIRRGDVPGVVDRAGVGDLALFGRELKVGDRPDPFVVAIHGRAWARAVLRAYRGGNPVAASEAHLWWPADE